MTNRAATASIKGFHYQFLHAVSMCVDILNSGKGSIICEGEEDLDYYEEGGKTYFQVKTIPKKINVTSTSFKKVILNFYISYLNKEDAKFVFHTNAEPGTDVIEGEPKMTLKKWIRQQRQDYEDKKLLLRL